MDRCPLNRCRPRPARTRLAGIRGTTVCRGQPDHGWQGSGRPLPTGASQSTAGRHPGDRGRPDLCRQRCGQPLWVAVCRITFSSKLLDRCWPRFVRALSTAIRWIAVERCPLNRGRPRPTRTRLAGNQRTALGQTSVDSHLAALRRPIAFNRDRAKHGQQRSTGSLSTGIAWNHGQQRSVHPRSSAIGPAEAWQTTPERRLGQRLSLAVGWVALGRGQLDRPRSSPSRLLTSNRRAELESDPASLILVVDQDSIRLEPGSIGPMSINRGLASGRSARSDEIVLQSSTRIRSSERTIAKRSRRQSIGPMVAQQSAVVDPARSARSLAAVTRRIHIENLPKLAECHFAPFCDFCDF